MGRAAPCRDGEETGTLENAGALEALRLDWGGAWDIGAAAPSGTQHPGTGPGPCSPGRPRPAWGSRCASVPGGGHGYEAVRRPGPSRSGRAVG